MARQGDVTGRIVGYLRPLIRWKLCSPCLDITVGISYLLFGRVIYFVLFGEPTRTSKYIHILYITSKRIDP